MPRYSMTLETLLKWHHAKHGGRPLGLRVVARLALQVLIALRGMHQFGFAVRKTHSARKY